MAGQWLEVERKEVEMEKKNHLITKLWMNVIKTMTNDSDVIQECHVFIKKINQNRIMAVLVTTQQLSAVPQWR